MKQIDELSIATIRSLCIDMINKAKSGHPGVALGGAPALYTLFSKHFVASGKDPMWVNRDRFVLSAGHGSSLLYAILHLSGYPISLDDLKSFRQLDSKTPGHPEFKHTPGVDATTGPLGQGLAEGVGLAMAEAALSNAYVDGKDLYNHYTYVFLGDGCLQEGISQEAINIAAMQKLNKLIVLYDSNNVTLDGGLDLSSIEDVKARFAASKWNVLEVKDGNDVDAIDNAISQAKKSKDYPTLVIINTIIGYGSKNQGTSKTHGAPLGEEDGKHAKVDVYHFDHEDFFVPEEVKEHFANTFIKRGNEAYDKYVAMVDKLSKDNKSEFARYNALKDWDLSKYIPDGLPEFDPSEVIPTRKASNKALEHLMVKIPNLYGGSADVASSVMTNVKDVPYFTCENRNGRLINFGIRELAMAAIVNGMNCHGGLRVFAGSFFVFIDYMKPAIRIAALSGIPSIYVCSHDSIAVGEDGPTHEPIEQLAMLRAIPNLNNFRPCDARETFASWKEALKRQDGPTTITLSRQALPFIENSSEEGVSKGAYIISEEDKNADLIIIATGSEVSLALKVKEACKGKKDIRIVSMPCWEIFDQQDDEYKQSVLGDNKDKVMSLEMLSTFGWQKYATHNYGINEFGKSAPSSAVMKTYGFTVEDVTSYVLNIK